MKTLHITVMGRVQGVWFRAGAKEMADRLGLSGWACNTLDGSVEILAHGEKDDVEKFVEWCRQGPPSAKIEKVEVEEAREEKNGSPTVPEEEGFRVR